MLNFKIIFCKHKNTAFIRNVYGDEINGISLTKVYRSIHKCTNCGKIIYKGELHDITNIKSPSR